MLGASSNNVLTIIEIKKPLHHNLATNLSSSFKNFQVLYFGGVFLIRRISQASRFDFASVGCYIKGIHGFMKQGHELNLLIDARVQLRISIIKIFVWSKICAFIVFFDSLSKLQSMLTKFYRKSVCLKVQKYFKIHSSLRL